jgi:enoyl-[acyl-carrier protein] reductase III
MLYKENAMKKQALIIGGSSGIGLAAAVKFASHNYDLTIVHRDRRSQIETFDSKINLLRNEFNCEIKTFNIDATNREKVEEILSQLAPKNQSYQLVLHAVSRGNLKPLIHKSDPSLTSQDLQLTIDAMGTNLHLWTDLLLKKNLIGQGTRIVALTSEGNDKYWSGYGAVALAKSTLETLVKYLSVELAQFGITVNAIKAGVTNTPSLRMIPKSEQLIEATEKRNPFGRLTTPEDVANAVYLLSLQEANWINGSIIHVDGGEHLI